jgi:hypothetical protein
MRNPTSSPITRYRLLITIPCRHGVGLQANVVGRNVEQYDQFFHQSEKSGAAVMEPQRGTGRSSLT